MSGRFAGKVAVVIGGTSGIGRETALRFGHAGASVVITGRRENLGTEVAAAIIKGGHEALYVRADTTRAADMERVVQLTVKTFGHINCAFNNAGWEGPGVIAGKIDESDWLRMMDVKLNGVWRALKYEVAAMDKGGGAIVNMAGTWGLVGAPYQAAYCAAAHGIVGLTRAAAKDYARAGIRINAICPSAVDAPILDRIIGGDPVLKQSLAEQQPIGRLCRPDEVASAVLWLCSEEASYISGTALVMDGG